MNYLYLEKPMHIRQFDLYLNYPIKDKPEILQKLDILSDGTVMAVLEDAVSPYFSDQDIQNIRMGRKPFYKKDFEVTDEGSLFRYLALMIEKE